PAARGPAATGSWRANRQPWRRRHAVSFHDLDRASDRHAATCRFSTAAILRQPSILRNLICPLAIMLQSRTSAASSLGSEACVLTRRRNSSWSRSIVLVVRSVFHCALGKVKNVRSSSPPSRRLVTTPGHRLLHVRSKAA